MGQGVFDFFAAAGFGISGFLINGMTLNLSWLWMILALAGLIWSIALSSIEDEGALVFLKQLGCILISAVCFFAYLKVDLAPYSYLAPGKLEAELGRTQGTALVPVYPIFLIGRAMMVDGREMLSKGKSTSIPGVVMQADLLTTDEEVLDDPQLKANLAIWNQIVAPYILKQDPAIEAALAQAGLLQTFMVPMPSSREYVGVTGDQSQKVAEILATSKIGVADMLCTLQTYIETASGRLGGAMWTSENGTCIDPNIRVSLASAPKKASSMPTIFKKPPQAAWDQGQTLISSMRSAAGVDSSVQTISSLAQLYEKIGQSTLYVAANNYAADSDKVVVLGTACDKLSTANDGAACSSTQAGLAGAAGGVSASAGTMVQSAKESTWEATKSKFAFFGGWFTTSVFRLIISALSAMTAQVIPYAIGIGITCSLLLSHIGPFLLLWPRRFVIAMEWMIGPVLFISLWGLLHNVWTEIDTWIMLLVGQIGSIVSGDRMMGKNVAGILCSLGYLGMPFLAYTILFGKVGQAIAKSTGMTGAAVKLGAMTTLFVARLATQMGGGGGKGGGAAGAGNSPGASGGGSGGGSPGGAPPMSSPVQSSPQTGSKSGPQGGAQSEGTSGSTSGGSSQPSSSPPPSSSGAGSSGSAGTPNYGVSGNRPLGNLVATSPPGTPGSGASNQGAAKKFEPLPPG